MRTRLSVVLGLALVGCSSSSVNDEQATGGGSGGGGTAGVGGGAGASSGGSSAGAPSGGGVAGTTSSGGGGAPTNCSGAPLACVECCAAAIPDGYAEFLDEFKATQCASEACSGSCSEVCFGSPPKVLQSCADCLYVTTPTRHTKVKQSCALSGHDDCQAFAICLETCQPG